MKVGRLHGWHLQWCFRTRAPHRDTRVPYRKIAKEEISNKIGTYKELRAHVI